MRKGGREKTWGKEEYEVGKKKDREIIWQIYYKSRCNYEQLDMLLKGRCNYEEFWRTSSLFLVVFSFLPERGHRVMAGAGAASGVAIGTREEGDDQRWSEEHVI